MALEVVGSSPISHPKKEVTFVYQKLLLFFYPSRRLGMESTRPHVVWNPDAVAHGIARSAYKIKSLRLDAIHGVAVIPSRPLV